VFQEYIYRGMPVFAAQLCLQNNGRPAAVALVELVRAACEGHAAGISLEQLHLELEHGGHVDHQMQSPGYWLTAADRTYRRQWLKAASPGLPTKCSPDLSPAGPSPQRGLQVYFTLEEAEADRGHHRQPDPADAPLRSLVLRTLAGQASGEEQTRVAFDRALATSGEQPGACYRGI
jgi:hypothetical protein